MSEHASHSFFVGRRVETEAAARSVGSKQSVAALPRAKKLRRYTDTPAQRADAEDVFLRRDHERIVQRLNNASTAPIGRGVAAASRCLHGSPGR
jgi:hypothetical protein